MNQNMPTQETEQKEVERREMSMSANIHGIGRARLDHVIEKTRDYFRLHLGDYDVVIFLTPEEKAELQRILAMPAKEYAD